MRGSAVLLLSACIIVPATLRAEVPQLISYQGRVVVNGTNFTGSGQFKFALIDPGPPSVISRWSNDGTSVAGSQPAASVQLPVSKGLFSVLIGDTTVPNMASLSASVFTNQNLYMRLWFNGGSGFQLLAPDQRISSVAYAMVAGSLPLNTITSGMIQDGTIQSADIAPGVIEYKPLSRPSKAGRVLIDWNNWFVPQAHMTVAFGTNFAAVPIVTVNAQVLEGPLLTDQATVTAVTKSNFTAKVACFSELRCESTAESLDGTPQTESNISMVDLFGSPAIAYYDDTWSGEEGVRFKRAFDTDWSGIYADNTSSYRVTWKKDPIMVVSGVLASAHISLAVVSSNPAICYVDTSGPSYRLRYVRATNAWNDIYSGNNTITSWAAPVTVATSSDFSTTRPEMRVVNGRPAVCYFDGQVGNEGLKFVRANDAIGTVWLTPKTVATNLSVQPDASMAVISGNPAICWYCNTPSAEGIKFTRASNAGGSTWGSAVYAVSGLLSQAGCSLAEIGGTPAISFFHDPWGMESFLKYVRAANPTGTAWTEPLFVDDDEWMTLERQSTLIDLGGKPAIAWQCQSEVYCARARDSGGSAWDTIEVLDEYTPSPWWGMAFAAIGGDPAIVFLERDWRGWGPLWEIRLLLSPGREAYLNWVAVEP